MSRSTSLDQYKQVIVVRTDLDMSLGKISAQACHASLGASEEARSRNPKIWREWLSAGGRKIVLRVESKEELIDLSKRARSSGIPRYLVKDRGLTEIPPGSYTAIGIGPDNSSKIDKLTGNIPLLK